ncbi:MAG: alpha/beta fold hydrolase [Oligoflexales bacterium]
MKRKSINTDQGHFSYLHWYHQDLPSLIFIHANGFNALTYRSSLELLSMEFEIYALDLRGHGFSKASARPNEFNSWEIYIQDILSFIKVLNSPVFLVGHSLGSMLCLAIASRYPQLVSHLLMVEPIIMTPIQCKFWALSKWFCLNDRLKIAAKAKKRRRVFKNREQILNSYTGKGAFATWPQDVLVDYVDGGTKTSTTGELELTCHPTWESISFANTTHQTWKWLKELKVKNRLVYATSSSTCSSTSVGIIHRIFPHIVTSKCQGSHFLPMEKKDCLLSEISILRST